MRQSSDQNESQMPRSPSDEYITGENRTRNETEREEVEIEGIEVDELDEAELSHQPLNQSISVRSLNVCGVNQINNGQQRNSIRIFASAVDLSSSVERSETPPPPYTYAVNN